ncbi:thioredoxin [Bacteroidales bacterium OttesenSCG-928-B11]|nr:thioredoxin [Bacteroidales bacterium OttesenSCG-928-C03]MDL2313029.1 thioredoxin [Bacteroidales bacterium OttesenSCG-928-B11]MDL2326837.1 thioredoxin [Bacteroidales bacterium OttesenSCG-928-A14]
METFHNIIKGDLPVLVDFFATWCGPCRSYSPIVESVAKEYSGKLRVLKIDIDKNREFASQYQIQSVPTTIIFKQGNMVYRQSGVLDAGELKKSVEQFL